MASGEATTRWRRGLGCEDEVGKRKDQRQKMVEGVEKSTDLSTGPVCSGHLEPELAAVLVLGRVTRVVVAGLEPFVPIEVLRVSRLVRLVESRELYGCKQEGKRKGPVSHVVDLDRAKRLEDGTDKRHRAGPSCRASSSCAIPCVAPNCPCGRPPPPPSRQSPCRCRPSSSCGALRRQCLARP